MLPFLQPFHDSTVPTWSLVFLSLIGPIAIIVATSMLLLDRRHAARDAWCSTKAVLASIAVTELITGTLKVIVGRLRPNFLYSCWPDGNTMVRLSRPPYLRIVSSLVTPTSQSYLLRDGHNSNTAC